MKFYLSNKIVKAVLALGIMPLFYLIGYSLGYTNQLSSSKAVTQQPKPQSKLAPPKKNRVIQNRLVVKRGVRRVYVYRGEKVVAAFPIAIGKPGWETPLGNYRIIDMEKDPIFRNFKTGEIIKPGAKNPLGKRLIIFHTGKKLDLGFHGTNEDKLIGKAVSHGCIRMHDKDVIRLYEMVKIGTPVAILP